MTTLVTIGPTQEPLDAMRILSNRSSGTLGSQLAMTLAQAGHRVIALRGTGVTADASPLLSAGIFIIPFTTTADLQNAIQQLASEQEIHAIFHAAAVSDFYFPEAGSGKIPTSDGTLTLTLQPTPKILPRLRDWFPKATITGWKFEASGNKASALEVAKKQLIVCQSDACVLNGPSYGEGFGYLTRTKPLHHFADATALCHFLCSQDVTSQGVSE